MQRKSTEQRQLDVLFVAKALAGFIFGDEEQWRRVYMLKSELGLFKIREQICGRPATISQRIAACEADSTSQRAVGLGAAKPTRYSDRGTQKA